ncbi:hypothetical protein LZ31DRAFT_614282 [Colletotrichum somersetense]|nr:hypothetical protein LZ31DRAFT_614282 [Colletotrichum somersetense]
MAQLPGMKEKGREISTNAGGGCPLVSPSSSPSISKSAPPPAQAPPSAALPYLDIVTFDVPFLLPWTFSLPREVEARMALVMPGPEWSGHGNAWEERERRGPSSPRLR